MRAKKKLKKKKAENVKMKTWPRYANGHTKFINGVMIHNMLLRHCAAISYTK